MDSLDSNITNFPLGLKSFLNHSQVYLTILLLRLRWFQVGVDMCRRQMLLGQVSYVMVSWTDCGQLQVVQVLCLIVFYASLAVFSYIYPHAGVHMHAYR